MWYHSMDSKGYELANDSKNAVPSGSLDYLSTIHEVLIFKSQYIIMIYCRLKFSTLILLIESFCIGNKVI